MAIHSQERDKSALYSAARAWGQRSLLEERSVLSDADQLWTSDVLTELDQRFVQNFDAGEGTFLEKLKAQLAGGSPQCHRLMAELMWALNLFPSNVGASSKRQTVMEIWSWSGASLRADAPMLSDDVLMGIGSAGTAYITQRWRELSFAITILRELRSLGAEDQREILTDPWRLLTWLQSQPGAGQRQLLHILPHLMYPSEFERISSGGDKVAILAAFTDEPRQIWLKRSPENIDRALLELRGKLEAESGKPIDFYSAELRPRWKSAPVKGPGDSQPSFGRGFADALNAFLAAYGSARQGAFTTAGPVAESMTQLRRWLEGCAPVKSRPSIKVKLSVGQGGWTKTPWIALLDERVTTSTQRGTYIVFLIAVKRRSKGTPDRRRRGTPFSDNMMLVC